MNNVIIIPARMGSSRFPGKPLIDLLGLPMIIHVWARCKMSKNIDEVYVATCDKIIKNICKKYNAKVIMTSKKHSMCMERVCEAARKINAKNIITVQGDEPLITPNDIKLITSKLKTISSDETINLIQKIKLPKEIDDPNRVKVIINKSKYILYISRETIPSRKKSKNFKSYFKLGNIYAMRKNFLKKYEKLSSSKLEIVESVDMNRILDHGFRILSVQSNSNLVSIDVPRDVKMVKKLMKKDQIFYKLKKKYAKGQ